MNTSEGESSGARTTALEARMDAMEQRQEEQFGQLSVMLKTLLEAQGLSERSPNRASTPSSADNQPSSASIAPQNPVPVARPTAAGNPSAGAYSDEALARHAPGPTHTPSPRDSVYIPDTYNAREPTRRDPRRDSFFDAAVEREHDENFKFEGASEVSAPTARRY